VREGAVGSVTAYVFLAVLRLRDREYASGSSIAPVALAVDWAREEPGRLSTLLDHPDERALSPSSTRAVPSELPTLLAWTVVPPFVLAREACDPPPW
jgi:hypothetical protein